MNKKYQIFISSTFSDLHEERNAVMKAIIDLDHIPSGMELFPAYDQDQLSYIKQVIDQCDYYVLLVSGKYGSVDESGVSFTEREYEYALSTHKPVLAFIRHSDVKLLAEQVETDTSRSLSLERFKSKIKTGRIVKFWTDSNDLSNQVMVSLLHATKHSPQIGWVRANELADIDAVRKINTLNEENRTLIERLAEYESRDDLKVQNIASLDENFEFKARSSYKVGSTRRVVTEDLSFTWNEIALAILPFITGARMEIVIRSLICDAYNRKHGRSRDYLTMDSADEVAILIQLEQYGFIERITANFKDHGSKPAIRVTRRGKEFVTNAITARSKKTDLHTRSDDGPVTPQ